MHGRTDTGRAMDGLKVDKRTMDGRIVWTVELLEHVVGPGIRLDSSSTVRFTYMSTKSETIKRLQVRI